MMIFKFTLEVTDVQHIMIPKGSIVLSVQAQFNEPKLWVLVDEKASLESRTFVTYGTGHPVPDHYGRFIGTYQLCDGDLVFHVFEET